MKSKSKKVIRFDVLTIFPKILDSYVSESILGRAQKRKLIEIKTFDLREFTTDKHKKVDDKPFGGGPGMVLKIEPIYRLVQFLNLKFKSQSGKFKKRIILFSTRGKKFDSSVAKRLSRYDQLILICGRYEGVDERVAKYVADEEISVGDFVLSGGELPALILIEGVSRFLPGVLGKYESLEDIKGSYPVFTQPKDFKPGAKIKWRVPKVLLSGNHKKIEEWRRENSSSR